MSCEVLFLVLVFRGRREPEHDQWKVIRLDLRQHLSMMTVFSNEGHSGKINLECNLEVRVFHTAELDYNFHFCLLIEFLLKLLVVNVVENEGWILFVSVESI